MSSVLSMTQPHKIWFQTGQWHGKSVLGNDCVDLVPVGATQSQLAKLVILNCYGIAVHCSHQCPLKFLPTENLYLDLICHKLRKEWSVWNMVTKQNKFLFMASEKTNLKSQPVSLCLYLGDQDGMCTEQQHPQCIKIDCRS